MHLQLAIAKTRYWLYALAAYWAWFGGGAIIAIFIQMIGRK
jgi:hypothetical protein